MPIRRLTAGGGGGLDTSDATATAGDVRTGTTAYVATGKVTGTSTATTGIGLGPSSNPVVPSLPTVTYDATVA